MQFFFLSCILAYLVQSTLSCRCLPTTPCEAIKQNDVAVKAKILRYNAIWSSGGRFEEVEAVALHIIKGSVKLGRFTFNTSTSSAACALKLKLGEKYLLVLSARNGLWGNSCGGSTIWSSEYLSCGSTSCDPGRCNKMYRPVCGSDGKTYSNKCVFNAAKKCNPKLTHTPGPCCDPTPICTAEFAPVCGSDGKTYSNLCFFNAAKKCGGKLTYTPGECCDPNPICTEQFKPVCGSDGKTYSNLCFFNAAQACNSKLTYTEGRCACKPTAICTKDYRPVCGSDGKTYSNLCMFNAAQSCDRSLTYESGECCCPPVMHAGQGPCKECGFRG